MRVEDTKEQLGYSQSSQYQFRISAEVFTVFIGEAEHESAMRQKALRELNHHMYGNIVTELSALRRELITRRDYDIADHLQSMRRDYDIADRLQSIIEELV